MIIALVAQKQSGKTTVSEYLCNNYGFTCLSHAKPLKDAVGILFDLSHNDLYTEERKNREIKIPSKFNHRNIEIASEIVTGSPQVRLFSSEVIPHFKGRTMTVRLILQEFGTDVCRKLFGEDIWLDNLNRRIELCDSSVVIDDCRFLNEAVNLRSKDALMIGLQRPPMNMSDLHQSEVEMIENWDTMVDTTIVNSGTLECLYAMVEDEIFKE